MATSGLKVACLEIGCQSWPLAPTCGPCWADLRREAAGAGRLEAISAEYYVLNSVLCISRLRTGKEYS